MKDKKQKNEQNAGAIAAKPKKKKKVLIVVLVIVAVLVVWIGTSIHNATKQVAMAVNTVEVEPVQKRDLSDTISVKGTVAGASSTNVTSKAASEITNSDFRLCSTRQSRSQARLCVCTQSSGFRPDRTNL